MFEPCQDQKSLEGRATPTYKPGIARNINWKACVEHTLRNDSISIADILKP